MGWVELYKVNIIDRPNFLNNDRKKLENPN